MDVKRQVTRGGQVIAYEIVDGSETYFVHKDALINDVTLPELLRSGWELLSIPDGLSKNGVGINDLPKLERSFTPEEEMDMQIPRGGEIPLDELRSMLSKDSKHALKAEEGAFTIQTRDEFLNYLLKTESKHPSDFYPINYLVHPAARFSLEEYTDPSNQQWVRLLEQHRVLTVEQFENLKDWAISMGLPEDYSSTDLLFFYFRWGICGLDLPILSKTKQDRYFHVGSHPSNPDSHFYYTGYGLVDNNGGLLRESVAEKFQIANPNVFEATRSACRGNEVKPVQLRARIVNVVEEWNTAKGAVTVSFDELTIAGRSYPSMSVRYKFQTIPRNLLRYDQSDALYVDVFLRSLADEFLRKRTVQVDISTYRALCSSGCSPLSAIIAALPGINGFASGDTEEDTGISLRDIPAYLSNQLNNEVAKSTLEDFLAGQLNCDKLAAGIASDTAQTASDVYIHLYCAHHILGVSLEDIYNSVQNFKQGEELSFSANGVVLHVPSTPIDGAYRGFMQDLADYRKQQFDGCYSMLWIDLVTRVPSSGESDKHVGLRCYRLDKERGLKEALAHTQKVYTDAASKIADPAERTRLLRNAPYESASILFQCILSGGYRFPQEFGNKLYRPEPELLASWKRAKWFKGPFYTDTVSICDSMALEGGATPEWCIYTVNAVVTPYRVKPRKGFLIRETSLNAVWSDISSLPIYKAVRQNRAILPSDGFWHTECCMHPYFTDPDHFSLLQYYEGIADIRVMNDETGSQDAPHILEMKYPLFVSEEADVLSNRKEFLPLSCGHGKILSYERDSVVVKEVHHVVSPFVAPTAEDLFYTKGKYDLPDAHGKMPVVVIDERIFANNKEIRPADVELLKQEEYPITHLCGRRYVIADVKNRLWVVEV